MENVQQISTNLSRLVGRRIKGAREALGMTQDEVAAALTAQGYPTQRVTVTRTENATRPVTLDDLAAFAAVLDVPVSLFTNDGKSQAQATAKVEEYVMIADVAMLQAQHAIEKLKHLVEAQQGAIAAMEDFYG